MERSFTLGTRVHPEIRSFREDMADEPYRRFLIQYLEAMALEPFTARERAHARMVFEALALRAEGLLGEGA